MPRFIHSALLFLAPFSILELQSKPSREGLEGVVELTRRGAFPQALELAESQSSALERAQSKLYVLHQAGDLPGALKTGIDELRSTPQDLWLLERVCYITLSFRATDLARDYIDRFAKTVEMADLLPTERAQWQGLLADYQQQEQVLEQGARDRSRAAWRARVAVFSGLTLSLGAWFFLMVGRSRKVAGQPTCRG
jgi:hypothetical protein